MNDLDKKDLLELANIIKSSAFKVREVFLLMSNSTIINLDHLDTLDQIEEITGSADVIIEIVENKPHKIERMF